MKLRILESINYLPSQEYLKQLRDSLTSVPKNEKYIFIEELTPNERYFLADKLAEETASKDNFYMNSVGFWTKCSKPRRPCDYDSTTMKTIYHKGKASKYWYTTEGVYRHSNHWGSDIASCSWYIDGLKYRNEGCFIGNMETAFIKWKDLKPKGVILQDTKEEIEKSTFLSNLYAGLELNNIMYRPFGFKFEK